jgi:hypothetical protein
VTVDRRQRGIVFLALALGAVGLVWVGQGLGILQGSGFMVNDVRWAIAGVGLVVAGAVLGGIAVVRSRDSR